jgi:hypothetical protein
LIDLLVDWLIEAIHDIRKKESQASRGVHKRRARLGINNSAALAASEAVW